MGSKGLLILNVLLALGSCSAAAAAGDHETALVAQFKAATPAERAKLAGNLSYRNDTPTMVAALVPLLKNDDAELRADTAYVLRGFYSRALQSAIPELIVALTDDPAWRVRANVAYALMNVPESAGTLAAFGKCATDRDERVRAACAKGLGTVAKAQHAGDSQVVSLLATDLGDDSRLVRYGAAKGFAKLASTDPAAIHALAGRLDAEPDPWVRGAIAQAIAASGPSAEPALPSLMRAVVDPLPLYTANQVVAAMAAIGAPAVPTLIATLGYRGSPETGSSRRAAIAAKAALLKLEVPMTAPLILALQHGPAQQRAFAADVLGEKGAEAVGTISVLTTALKDDDTGVRQAAAKSLGQLAAYDDAALPALLGALNDPDEGVRESAVNALNDGLGGAFISKDRALAASRAGKTMAKSVDVLPPQLVAQTAHALGAHLGDADITVAAIAAQALGKMGAQAAPALGDLKAALLAPHGDNAREAADTLAEMGSIGVPVLIEAVRKGASPADGSAIGVRGRAAVGLATLSWKKQLGDNKAAAVAVLIDGLSDPRSDVRGGAAGALGNLGHAGDVTSMKSTVVAALKGAMTREQDENAKQSMQLAMRNWGVGS